MQAEVKNFNPPYLVRFLAVSRAYFCADLASEVNARKHRAGISSTTLRQPAPRPQCAPPSV